MSTNQVWKDDGSGRIDNDGIMNMIIDEYEAFQRDHQDRIFKGLKVIYCTPRSFSEEEVRKALDECLRFKQDKRFSSYIAGKRSCKVVLRAPVHQHQAGLLTAAPQASIWSGKRARAGP